MKPSDCTHRKTTTIKKVRNGKKKAKGSTKVCANCARKLVATGNWGY